MPTGQEAVSLTLKLVSERNWMGYETTAEFVGEKARITTSGLSP
jgi:hypothetical protein